VRVLVTGAAGFIGSHVVDALLARGDAVAAIDHLRRRPRPWLADAMRRGLDLHVGDIRDLDLVSAAVASARPEVVLHLAAQVDVRRSVADPSFDAMVNVAGTVAVLEAARQAGTPRVVLASTAAVYGDPQMIPTPETAPIAPLSPYGTSKAAAEWYLAQYARLHGLSTLALRMANVYGPRQDPHGEAGVIAIFTGAAATGEAVTVYGSGEQTRDYVVVDDVVEAWLRATQADVTGAVNIGTGVESSVRDLARALGVRERRAPARPGEVERSCLDPRRAREALGWEARAPLADGLGRTVEALRRAGD
jgi:UDP-glucose 4-epimerase